MIVPQQCSIHSMIVSEVTVKGISKSGMYQAIQT